MSHRQQLCLLAVFIPILYLSGIPTFWKGCAFVLVSVYLLAFAYRTRIEAIVISQESRQKSYEKPVATPPMHSTSSSSSHDTVVVDTTVTPAPQDTAANANA